MTVKKFPSIVAYLFRMRFEREVACIIEVYLCIRDIALPGLSACGHEKRFVLSPDCQQGWRTRIAGLTAKDINIARPLLAVVHLRRCVIFSR